MHVLFLPHLSDPLANPVSFFSIYIQKLITSHALPPPTLVQTIIIFHAHFCDSFLTGLPAFPHASSHSQHRSQNKLKFKHKSDCPTPLLKMLSTMEYYSATRKKEVLPFITTWMDPEGFVLSEMSEKEKYYDLTCMWNLRKPNL